MKSLKIIYLTALALISSSLYATTDTVKTTNVVETVCSKTQIEATKTILHKGKDYLFVITAEKGNFKALTGDKYELILQHVYPHVLFFGNQKVPKTGTLFASSFLKKLNANVLDANSPTTMRIKLYRGHNFHNQLAQPLEVEVISIKKIDKKKWKFVIKIPEKGSLDGLTDIVYPDLYIFNSDLPGKGFIDS